MIMDRANKTSVHTINPTLGVTRNDPLEAIGAVTARGAIYVST
jgi:hypothetical protein